MVKHLDRVLCKELESVSHLFFECVVDRCIWSDIAIMFNVTVLDFESLARHWINHKTMSVFNLLSAAVLWGLWEWECRNDIVFNNVLWINIKQVWGKVLRNIKSWKVLLPEHARGSDYSRGWNKFYYFFGGLCCCTRRRLALAGVGIWFCLDQDCGDWARRRGPDEGNGDWPGDQPVKLSHPLKSALIVGLCREFWWVKSLGIFAM